MSADRFTVYFDTETGGVDPTRPTIQLAAVAVNQDGRECSAFWQNIAFNEADCDPDALKLNHYDREAWVNAVTPAVCAAKFAAWVKKYASVTMTSKRTGRPYTVAQLAGYNALVFDLPRLRALFGAAFFPCSYQVRDVLQRVLFYFDEYPNVPKPENFKLSTVAAHFGIATDGAHDALADARMSASLYRAVTAKGGILITAIAPAVVTQELTADEVFSQ